MKVSTKNGVVMLTSETVDEAITMFSMALNSRTEQKQKKVLRRAFEPKKCPVCERVCTSGAGLASHVKKSHPDVWVAST